MLVEELKKVEGISDRKGFFLSGEENVFFSCEKWAVIESNLEFPRPPSFSIFLYLPF